LVPFLPKSSNSNWWRKAITAISAALGSTLVCLISYGYICMLGAEGLKQSTEYAILNAKLYKRN
jgi:glycine dehydrogenase